MYVDELLQAAKSFFDQPRTINLIGASSGYSGSHMAQVVDKKGKTWCVRLWHNEALEQLQLIHQVLQHSRTRCSAFMPQLASDSIGNTLVPCGESWAEAQSWVMGVPVNQLSRPLSAERVPNTGHHVTTTARRQIATALALFHLSMENLPLPVGIVIPAPNELCIPTVQHTQTALPGLHLHYTIGASRGSAEEQATLENWLTAIPSLLAALERQKWLAAEQQLSNATACHCDLWPDHVYFVDDQLSGLIDFGAVAYTTRAVDVAQLILHFGGWSTANETLSVYQTVCPLPHQDLKLLPLLAACDVLAEGVWALQALQNAQLSPIEQAAHLHNLRFLLPSLVQLTNHLTHNYASTVDIHSAEESNRR